MSVRAIHPPGGGGRGSGGAVVGEQDLAARVDDQEAGPVRLDRLARLQGQRRAEPAPRARAVRPPVAVPAAVLQQRRHQFSGFERVP